MDDLEREPPEGLTYPPVTDAERARRREAALAEGPPTCSCGKATSFDAKVVGMTCGGLYLRGWYMCPDGHGTLASGLAEVCREVWSTFLTRSASDRHRRNHRNIYGKKHGVIVAKYDRASQPSSAEKPK